MSKALIVGAAGFVGSYLARTINALLILSFPFIYK